jgi:hypothetical protein
MARQYVLFCEPCGYKQMLDKPTDVPGLVPIKTAPVPGGIPTLDPVTKKMTQKDDYILMPKYKCPKCGRGVTVKRVHHKPQG